MLNLALASNPPFTAALVSWAVVSAVLTALLRFRSDQEWIAMASRSPRVAAVVAFVRALGIDPVGALAALRAFLLGKAPCPLPSPQPSPADPSEGSSSVGTAPGRTASALATGALFLSLAVGGCSVPSGVCEIIDTLDNVCTVIVVRGPDGSRREVRVTRGELESLGQRILARDGLDGSAPIQ